MTAIIRTTAYTPEYVDSYTPVWPDEIHVLPSGRAKACHADSGDHSYRNLEDLAQFVAINTREAA